MTEREAALKPEVLAVLRQMNDQSKALMEALADLVRQPDYLFKKAPLQEFIDRTEAMRNVVRIREAHSQLVHTARTALVAHGVSASPGKSESGKTPMGGGT